MDEPIQRLASLLVNHKLEHAFGITGSGPSLDLIGELERLGVRYYSVSHEASAAIMAGTVARVTDRLSVSISIKGPGLVNMLPGIAYNHFENNPALSISEAFGTTVPSHQKHKRLDHAALLSPLVKGITSLRKLDKRLPALLDAARREIPGPVHLDLCISKTERGPRTFSHCDASPRQRPKKKFFTYLDASRRPILVIGSLALRKKWREELATLNIPVFTTVSAKGVLDERSAHSAGVFTGSGKELAPESLLFAAADLVVGIGLRNTEVLVPRPFGKPTILLDEMNGHLAEGFKADLSVTDADANFVPEVLNGLQGKHWGSDSVALSRCRMEKALLTAGWLPAACFGLLNDLDFSYTLVLDSGSFCTIGEHLWQARTDRLFMGSSNGRYLGTALPCAIAAALCRAHVPVFCVVGDGGMRAYPAEIKLAVQERLPLCVILMTDGRYGSVACIPRSGPVSDRAVKVFQPSWLKPVEAMSCAARAVSSEDSFAAALQGWNRQEPLFIEASFEPQAYANMTSRLR